MHYSSYDLDQPKVQQDYHLLSSGCYNSINAIQEFFYSLFNCLNKLVSIVNLFSVKTHKHKFKLYSFYLGLIQVVFLHLPLRIFIYPCYNSFC